MQSLIPPVREELQSIRKQALELVIKEKRLNELMEMGRGIEEEWMKIAGGGIDQQRSILKLFSKLIPNYVNCHRGLTGLKVIEQTTIEDSDLGRKEELLPLAIETSRQNEQTLLKMFGEKMRTYNALYAHIKETNSNMENAFAQLDGTCEAYERVVSETGWAVRRQTPESEFYASPFTGEPRDVLAKVFSPANFTSQLADALNNGDFAAAAELVEKYRKFQSRTEELNSKYTKALTHFKYYAQILRSTNLSILWDMSGASRLESAQLKVPAVSSKDMQIAQGGFTRYLGCFETVPELPAAELPPSSAGGKALMLFDIWDMIEKEGGSWVDLDELSFGGKISELTRQINEIASESRLEAAAGKVLELLGRIKGEWHEKNGGSSDPGPDGDSFGAHALYRLHDARLNTRSLDQVPGGEVALTDSDLIAGAMEITARLSAVERIQKLLISEDGGRTWAEIKKSPNISYRLSPAAGKSYQFLLKVKTVNSQEIILPVFPNINAIAYRIITYADLAQDAVVKLAEAYETQNAAAFADLISRDYLGNRVFLEEGVRFDFDMFTDIRLRIFIDRIEKHADQYVAETQWEKSQSPRRTGQRQNTTGKTVMTFLLEDGRFKIQNLRGNLIYATLSPEIAEASGLPQKVVEAIREARLARDPIQPGAGATIDSAEPNNSASNIQAGTFTLTQQEAFPGTMAGWAQGFVFSSYQVQPLQTGPDISHDFTKWDGNLEVRSGNGIVSLGAVGINSVTEAPAFGYASMTQPVGEETCAIRLGDGTYALIQPTTWVWGGPYPYTATFRYKHQKNGSRSFL
ncbi:MAG: hypothetical protein HQL11_02330 [Candidatus Omnitrophica bacterium]|nr:hypothetical protein [Candidatus Omnitrophota bacterium]